jgi:hypothetical protein
MSPELSAERIIPQAPDESHWIAEPCYTDGLIRAFSARMNLKVGSEDSLAYDRNSPGDRNQICIDAADDDNWLLRRQCVSPQNSDERLLGKKWGTCDRRQAAQKEDKHPFETVF